MIQDCSYLCDFRFIDVGIGSNGAQENRYRDGSVQMLMVHTLLKSVILPFDRELNQFEVYRNNLNFLTWTGCVQHRGEEQMDDRRVNRN